MPSWRSRPFEPMTPPQANTATHSASVVSLRSPDRIVGAELHVDFLCSQSCALLSLITLWVGNPGVPFSPSPGVRRLAPGLGCLQGDVPRHATWRGFYSK